MEEQMNLNEVVGTIMDENGIDNVTVGNATCATVSENLRGLLRAFDEPSYAKYREIRYPGGEGTDTLETRRDSVRFLFDASRDLLAPHYKPTGR
jgi:hypothetical protein